MKTLIILIIIVILLIMLFNNKNENMNNTNISHLTTKSNQAIQNLASMYNNNLLHATKADIPKIISTDISANQINTINISATNIDTKTVNTDTINVKNQIIAQRFCDKNNNCINLNNLERINNSFIIEHVFFRDEMVVWDNLNEHIQKDIFSIPNDKNITYALLMKKLNNETYILGINADTIFEIQMPKVPENSSYEYSVLWLQVEQSGINININGIDYYIPDNTVTTAPYTDYRTSISYNQIQAYNIFINLQENRNNNNFVWIPYIIKNLNQSKKIKISIKSQKYENSILWISGIAFSSNPLNLSINNISNNNSIVITDNEWMWTLSPQNFPSVVSQTEQNYNIQIQYNISGNNITLYNGNGSTNLFIYNENNKSIQDFIKNNKIQNTTYIRHIKIPYINSGKNKVLTLKKAEYYNVVTNFYIQTDVNKYESIGNGNNLTNVNNVNNINNISNIRNTLNKFFNENYHTIVIDKSLLNYDRDFINLKVEVNYINTQNENLFSINYDQSFQSQFWWWPYWINIKYKYSGVANIIIIGTYDYLLV